MIDLTSKRHFRLPGRVTLAVATGLGVLVLLSALATGVATYYGDRILPGIRVAGVAVGGLTPVEAAKRIAASATGYRISFEAGEQTFQPKPEAVGVTIEPATSAGRAYAIGHGSPLSWLGDWWRIRDPKARALPVSYHFNEAKLQAYVSQIVKTTSKPAVDASLAVSADQVQVVAETPGQETGVRDAPEKIRESLRGLAPVRLSVGVVKLEPVIHASDLTAAKAEAELILSQPVTLSYGQTTYRPTRAQRGAWLSFREDLSAKTDRVSVDQAAVGRYLAAAVTAKIAYAAVPKILQTNADTGEESLAQDGRDGLAVDQGRLVSGIAAALVSKQPYAETVPTSTVAYTTQTRTIYDRWIDVDLTQQRMWLYQRGDVIDTFLISSGRTATPSPVGTWTILSQVEKQTMSGFIGSYYYLPDVPWISWYKAGGYAIHGTYWHHNFGHPMSHGCLNLPIDKAEFVYHWAPPGTKVVIHGETPPS